MESGLTLANFCVQYPYAIPFTLYRVLGLHRVMGPLRVLGPRRVLRPHSFLGPLRSWVLLFWYASMHKVEHLLKY